MRHRARTRSVRREAGPSSITNVGGGDGDMHRGGHKEDLLLRDEDGERERLTKRDRDERDEQEPSCEEDTEPSLSERRLLRPKPLGSSLHIKSLIRLA